MQLIQRHTPELSYAEMREAMDQVQCTKQTMVDQDLEYFQKKFSKINRIRTSFVQLTQQITAKINELVQRSRISEPTERSLNMTTADELERCRRQLRELDEQEMLLASYQRKSQQLAEETYYNIQSAIRMIAENQQPLQQARQALGRLEYDFSEEVSHAKRKLYRQREELEIKYRKLNAQRES